jgi:hypothetical protein
MSSATFNVSSKVDMPKLPTSFTNPSGTGAASGAGHGGSGTGSNPFGSASGTQGLMGTFYDFTRTQGGDAVSPGYLGTILQDFIANHFRPPSSHPCYKSPNKIYANQLFVPVTPDEVAGAAFQSPESSKAYWLVHYHGVFTSSDAGKFRFVGWGDNVLAVSINGKLVLDASDKQYLSQPYSKNVGVMGITGPGKGEGTPLFTGDWFNLDIGTNITIDIVIGDEGGVTTSGLLIQPHSADLTFAPNGAPKIPLFILGTVGEGDKATMRKDLPVECFTTHLVFTPVTDSDGNL